jgi:hypothetical protein
MITTAEFTEQNPVADPLDRQAEPAPSVTTALVSTAVNLGWIIDKLWRITDGDEPSEDLPGLSIERKADVYCRQIESVVARFGSDVERDPELLAALRHVRTHLAAVQDPEAEAAVEKLHLTLLAGLTAAHDKFGKAYLLGSGLASLYRDGPGWIALSRNRCVHAHDRFDPCTIIAMLDALADLHCVLPHNSAATVSLSLQMTFPDEMSLRRRHGRSAEHLDITELRLQGHRWRAMLTSETGVVDVPGTADYLQAGMSLLADLRKLMRHTIRQFWLPLTVVGLLGATGIVLSFRPPFDLSAGGGVIGACVSFAAAFLAAVRIVSPSLMRVAERAAPRLWDEAVIRTVAEALPRLATPRQHAGAAHPRAQVPGPRPPSR